MQDNKLMKHLKKATGNTESRPMLQCAHYDEDGSITATNSHVLLRINDFHQLKESVNLNVYSMEFKIDGDYPDTKRLLPDNEKATSILTISLSVLQRAVMALRYTKGEHEVITLSIRDNFVEFSNHEDRNVDIPMTIKVAGQLEGDPIDIAFSASNLLRMTNFMLDAKQRYVLDDVNIYMTRPFRPVLCELEGGKYQYLVTPVRNS